MILRSSQSDQRSMYSRSSGDPAVESGVAPRADLPQAGDAGLHRQPAAVPDVVALQPRVGSGGRGPTRLMSPRRTFHSCGSSSSPVRRRNAAAPRQARIVASILNARPLHLVLIARARRAAASASARHRAELVAWWNGRPLSPTRVWRKSTGRPSRRRMMRANSSEERAQDDQEHAGLAAMSTAACRNSATARSGP